MEEFTNSIGFKIFYSAIAVLMIGFSLFLFNLDHSKASQWVIILPVIILILSLFIIASQIISKVIISADSIIRISVLGKKELQTANIKGCRIGEKTIYIEPLFPINSKISINNYSDLGNSEDLVQWLRENFNDLDAMDLAEEKSKILQNTNFGFTEKEREEKLTKAKQIATIYNIAGVVMGFATIPFNNRGVALLLLLYPLLGIIIMKSSNGLIKFLSNKKRSMYPFIMLGFFTPAMMMLFKSILEYDIFRYEHIWLIVFAITLLIFFLLYTIGINKSVEGVKGQLVFILILSVMYGYGGTIQVNCMFDNSKLQVYPATVLDHRIEKGKSNTYYLTLSPWGPMNEQKEISVHRWLYNEIAVGGTVKVNFKDGLFNIPWFTVSD